MTVQSLAYVGFESPRAADWLDFAPNVLGVAARQNDLGDVLVQTDDRHYRVALRPGERNRLDYIGWQVLDTDALDGLIKKLSDAGHPATHASEEECVARGVLAMAWCLDAAGFRHELFVGQLEQPSTFRPGRPHHGFVTDEQGLGHILIGVPELSRQRAFVDALGLRPSDRIRSLEGARRKINAHFFHANPRHHSLAMAESPGFRQIRHIMMQVKDIDDVGIAYDQCKAYDIPITVTLGRHTNDRMTSFYLATPSGFQIEYGWAGLEVTDPWTMGHYSEISIWGHHHTGYKIPDEEACVEAVG